MLIKLKVRILERYRSQSRFATCCGKGRKGENWISRIIQERDIPSEKDKALIIRKLRIENPDEFFQSGRS